MNSRYPSGSSRRTASSAAIPPVAERGPRARVNGEDDGQLARDLGSARIASASTVRRRAPGGAASRRDRRRARARCARACRARRSAAASPRACRSSCCRPCGSSRRATPSRMRLSTASGECMKRNSESASVTTRLISSGIVRSKLRSPASIWPTGISSFAAARLAPSVELTSPGTSTTSGPTRAAPARGAPSRARSARRASPSRPRACESGRRMPSSSKKTATSRRRSAARCGRGRGELSRPAASSATTGAVFMKFGRAPTTDNTVKGVPTAGHRRWRGGCARRPAPPHAR